MREKKVLMHSSWEDIFNARNRDITEVANSHVMSRNFTCK